MTGIVFDIKEFTVHDGPGLRVTVFLKGCPLKCAWCHNPEGLSPEPELMVKKSQCVHCGRCCQPCGHEPCQKYERCLFVCPKGLVSKCGEEWEAANLAEKLNEYAPFLKSGGVTFSGGEPLLQAAFVEDVCKRIPNLHKALQTSGYASAKTFRRLASAMNYVLFDLKLADGAAHEQYTGKGNALILENFAWLKSSGVPFEARIPLIPGVTDTQENLARLRGIAGDSRIEYLPYNPYAAAKYPWVERDYRLEEIKTL